MNLVESDPRYLSAWSSNKTTGQILIEIEESDA